MSNLWQEVINKKFKPLKFEIEMRMGSDIISWRTEIGGVCFTCQSDGGFDEQTSKPYSLGVWDRNAFIPMLLYLKEHEGEFKAYLEGWNENEKKE